MIIKVCYKMVWLGNMPPRKKKDKSGGAQAPEAAALQHLGIAIGKPFIIYLNWSKARAKSKVTSSLQKPCLG